MDKSAIKNYAVWARRKLIEDITQKAFEYGITEHKITEAIPVSSDTVQVGGKLLQKAEAKQRASLVERIREKGFNEVIEEIAYTWFNRIIAIRFMEVNEYLPTGVRVLSSIDTGKAVPDIVTHALHLDLDLNFEKVNTYLDNHNDDELFRYLFVKQCNKLNEILPYLFEKIEDYTELLLPNNLLIEGSVIRRLVEDISEDDFKEQVEIIGWLYQYYISEKKDQVFEALKKNVKITKETIPAATQLFTPDWIVKYMVENSLGRLWLEGHPDEALKAKWHYYLDEAEQEPEVQKKLAEIREKRKNLKPEDIKVLDPCMGSGHILVYAFDVLYDIYKSIGYSEKDIPKLILEHNLYGLDIDDRAAQLAYFAVMMKARNKSRRIFLENIIPHLYAIQSSSQYPKQAANLVIDQQTKLDYDKTQLKTEINYLLETFQDAKEFGSIIDVKKLDYDKLVGCVKTLCNDGKIGNFEDLLPLIEQAIVMSQKYDVVCTNPPYMNASGMTEKLKQFINQNYQDEKSDFFATFMIKCLMFSKTNFYVAMITMQSWMFLNSFQNMREKLINRYTINSLLQIGFNSFPGMNSQVAHAASFVFRNIMIPKYLGMYFSLNVTGEGSTVADKNQVFLDRKATNDFYIVNQEKFHVIPGMPIAYWIKDRGIDAFLNENIYSISTSASQNVTGNNNKYLRYFWEVAYNKIGLNKKWLPYAKGGNFRKWYGNLIDIINWTSEAREIYRTGHASQIIPQKYWYKKGITWGLITSGLPSFRLLPENSTFDKGGSSIFINDDKNFNLVLGMINSNVAFYFLKCLNPTLNFQVRDIRNLPLIINNTYKVRIDELVSDNILISQIDWDSFETSSDFKKHPLLNDDILRSENQLYDQKDDLFKYLTTRFCAWDSFTCKQFHQLKANEEELNRIFIEIYGLQDELTPEVEEKDITIRRADLNRDIRSFISYVFGCMFGRYNPDIEGLVYAGGEWDNSKYKTFNPDADNVIPITDEEYFNDDIVGRFIEFIKVIFGRDTLEKNLDFIASAFENKGNTSREVIRQYFIKDFYKDHVKTYQKKPIYWLFDSGKENGFKALIYMHGYDEFTVAKVRTDYLHRLQKMYEAEYKQCDILIDGNVSEHEKVVARKKKEKLQKQMQECLAYDQVIAHVANQRIKIDLDDGVTVNYAKFQEVEIPQGEGRKPVKADLLAKI